MADLTDEQAVLDYLGGNQPLATQRLTTLPSASAAGGGSVAPAVSLPGPVAPGAAVDTGAVTGGGSIAQPGPSTASIVAGAGEKALDLARQVVGSSGQDVTRGDTGGTSLSDQVRGTTVPGSAAEIDLAHFAGNPETMALSADSAVQGATEANALAPASVLPPATGSGLEAATSAALTEGASQVGEQVAEESLQVLLPTLAEALTGAGFAVSLLSPIWNKDAFSTKGIEDLFHPPDPFKETKDIRKDFSTGFPILEGANKNLGRFGEVTGTPDQQAQELLGIEGTAAQEIDQAPAISRFMSTAGGKRTGLVNPLDVSPYAKVTGGLENNALLSAVASVDRLGQLGKVPSEADVQMQGIPWRNPMGESVVNTVGQLAEGAGIPASTFAEGGPRPITPEESQLLQTPGQVLPTLLKILTSVNPDAASTPIGQQITALIQQSGGGEPTPPTTAAPQAQEAIQSAPPAPAPVMPSGPSGALGFASDMLGP